MPHVLRRRAEPSHRAGRRARARSRSRPTPTRTRWRALRGARRGARVRRALDLQPQRALRADRHATTAGARRSSDALRGFEGARRARSRTSTCTATRARPRCATCSASPRRSTRMVVGESQILGQVKDAYAPPPSRHARAGARPAVPRAFEVAKRVRTETDIGAYAVSIVVRGGRAGGADLRPARGPRRARRRRGRDGRAHGAPPARRRASASCCVVNRTRARGRGLAARAAAAAPGPRRHRGRARRRSTSWSADGRDRARAPREPMRRARHEGAQRAPALPHRHRRAARRRARRSAQVDNVFLYDVDDLGRVVAGNRERRAEEAEKALEHRAARDGALHGVVREARGRADDRGAARALRGRARGRDRARARPARRTSTSAIASSSSSTARRSSTGCCTGRRRSSGTWRRASGARELAGALRYLFRLDEQEGGPRAHDDATATHERGAPGKRRAREDPPRADADVESAPPRNRT